MPQPVVIVLSRDPQLTGEVPGWLQGRAEVRACDTLEELVDLARWIEPQGILADFRRSSSSTGDARTLDALQGRWPQAALAVLLPEGTGESLPPREGRLPFHLLRGRIDRAAVLSALREVVGEEPVVVPVEPAPVEEPATGVLSGISRRYETNSPQLKQVLHDLEIAARHDVTILLIGETGAGKTYLARLIHEVSPRRHEPFLPVACGALPSELIESELFGHMKGSFTSAHQDKEGKFLAARRGSILLDEIDVLGPEQQVKLLRVIETGEFEPVGSNNTQHSQARLIVASNLELQPLVEQGRFRPDLYYRLNMLKFVIPPLRQRKMDIVPLARKFMNQFALKHNIVIEQVDQGFLHGLMNYPWPGNVRELEHVVQRAVIYCREGVLTAQQLPHHILSGAAGPTNDPTVVLPEMTPPMPVMQINDRSLGGQIALTEKEIIEQTLFKNSFSRTKTALDLGISRVTLYNKMKRYGLLK